jgi:hypothetical protein
MLGMDGKQVPIPVSTYYTPSDIANVTFTVGTQPLSTRHLGITHLFALVDVAVGGSRRLALIGCHPYTTWFIYSQSLVLQPM